MIYVPTLPKQPVVVKLSQEQITEISNQVSRKASYEFSEEQINILSSKVSEYTVTTLRTLSNGNE